jgi:hypothetical protein
VSAFDLARRDGEDSLCGGCTAAFVEIPPRNPQRRCHALLISNKELTGYLDATSLCFEFTATNSHQEARFILFLHLNIKQLGFPVGL